MLVGVTPTHVCGFASVSRRREAGPLVFRVPRAGLQVEVHQRVNVRIVELIDTATGSRIELEGSRIPLTHSKDVIDALGKSRGCRSVAFWIVISVNFRFHEKG